MLIAHLVTKNVPNGTIIYLVGEEGLEPSRHCCQQILSLSCIPISPLAQTSDVHILS